jgi:uncharacterized repeat protein (TIGR03803 family)
MTPSRGRPVFGSFVASVFSIAVPLAALLFGIPASAAHAVEPSYSILHSFQSAESNPRGSLTSDGRGNLYGTTAQGGPSDGGAVFTIKTDGTGFQRLHAFTGGVNDGFHPEASLVLDDAGNLYGTTSGGGFSDRGTVFTIKEDGSGFEVLYSFAGGASDGSYPYASLTLDGTGNLYGTTVGGGPSDYGTVFKLRTDGTGFQLLHTFYGGAGDGRGPRASLLLDGSGTLYGTTTFGGQSPVSYPREGFFYDGFGILFSIKTDGTGFRILRAFPVNAIDGACPSGSVITDEAGYLYGLNGCRSSSNWGGTVFRIAKDGSAFQILHSFPGSANDGVYPVGSLVLDRSGTLYGMTSGSGTTFQAVLFKVRTDATGYQVLRTFVDPPDGTSPSGSLILVGSGTLYGTMAYGGFSNSGTVFGVDTDGSGLWVLHAFAGFTSDGSGPVASVIADASGYLYGTTTLGGVSDTGTVFRIRPDGTGFQLLHSFVGGQNDGATPWSAMVMDHSGNLYGTTPNGGPSSGGTIFRLRSDGSGFRLLHVFQGGAADGRYPGAALIFDGSGNLYGTTGGGGAAEAGTVFRMRVDGSGFQLLHTFNYGSASDGALPYASLLLDGFGNLYGIARAGGASNWGTVFKLRTDGMGFQLLHTFVGGDDGVGPGGSLTTDGSGSLFGTTGGGGPSGAGTIFRISSDGAGYQVLHAFTGAIEGGIPSAEGGTPSAVVAGFGNLYGTTQFGGPLGGGTVFSIKTDGTGLQILHAFDRRSVDGQNPVCSLLLDGLGNLYGTTANGGSANFGTIFTLWPNRHRPVETPGPFVPVGRH